MKTQRGTCYKNTPNAFETHLTTNIVDVNVHFLHTTLIHSNQEQAKIHIVSTKLCFLLVKTICEWKMYCTKKQNFKVFSNFLKAWNRVLIFSMFCSYRIMNEGFIMLITVNYKVLQQPKKYYRADTVQNNSSLYCIHTFNQKILSTFRPSFTI